MKKNPNRRKLRNYMIMRNIQFRLAFTNFVFMGIVLVVLVATLLWPLYDDMSHSKELWTQYVSASLLWRLMDRIALAMILIFVVGIVYQIIYSHRLCGPLVNFAHSFGKIGKRDLTRKVILRRHDFFKQEAVQFNTMQDSLRLHIRELRASHNAIASAAADLRPEQIVDRHISDQLRKAVQHNQELLDRWNTSA